MSTVGDHFCVCDILPFSKSRFLLSLPFLASRWFSAHWFLFCFPPENTLHSPLLLSPHGLNFFFSQGWCLFCVVTALLSRLYARNKVAQGHGGPKVLMGRKGKVAAAGQKNIKPIKGRVIREGFGDGFDSIQSILNAD